MTDNQLGFDGARYAGFEARKFGTFVDVGAAISIRKREVSDNIRILDARLRGHERVEERAHEDCAGMSR